MDAPKYFHPQFVSADFGVPNRVEIADERVQVCVLDLGSGILEQFVGHVDNVKEHHVPTEGIVIGLPFKNDCALVEQLLEVCFIEIPLLECLSHALDAVVGAPPVVQNEVVAHPRHIPIVYVSVDNTLVVEEDNVAKELAKFLNHDRVASLR